LVEDADDLAGPNAAFKDKKPVNDNQFDIEDSKRQNGTSPDEEGIHLTNLALMDHTLKEPENRYSQSRTSDTDSSDRESSIACGPASLPLPRRDRLASVYFG